MAKVKIFNIECIRPQESNFFSNGDEVWIRLQGSGQAAFSPASGTSTWQMVAGRTRELNMEVEFETTAALEVWDDDSAATNGGSVEQRDNELLGTKTFMVTDADDIVDQVESLDEGPDADGSVYKIRYSIIS